MVVGGKLHAVNLQAQGDYSAAQFTPDYLCQPNAFYNHQMSTATGYPGVGLSNILGGMPPPHT